jgi:N-acetylmuramoyl-L-alanine amidase
MFQNAHLDRSLLLASHIQDQFREKARRVDRGVKQAGFLVLYRTTMPGILVETGFLSNASEEQYLLSEEGQSNITSSIFLAFKDYKNGVPIRKKSESYDPGSQETGPEGDAKDTGIKEVAIATSTEKTDSSASGNNPANEKGVFFRIQLKTSPVAIKTNHPSFKGRKDIREYKQDGSFKYTAGNAKTFEEALDLQKQLRAQGFKDAFVVAFSNGKRISVDDARKLTGN